MRLGLSGDDIAHLDDASLRELVARLCAAELRRAGLPLSSLTAGGSQDAADGGIDVRVELPASTPALDFIRRPVTGFQAKTQPMAPSDVLAEMRPRRRGLRESIKRLLNAGGAYIIVNSKASTTDSALQRRRQAMRNALECEAESGQLDFYDQTRLATWVNAYAGVALWVRERINKPLAGWRPYGHWSGRSQATETSYIQDDSVRVTERNAVSARGLSAVQGIQAIRTVLAQPGGIARLAGLAGTGKTRLAEALFDPEIGASPLDRAIVLYTDLADEPTPSAQDMLRSLGASGDRAIVVVDNCNPGLHRTLRQISGAHSNKVSVLTIEYDIAEDEPEETSVFFLSPASDPVLLGILGTLATHLSQPDRIRIAEFSGGNARIALALARTVAAGESLGVLNDRELFRRLFYQGHAPSDELERIGEACALVYSFDGESIDDDAAELPVLAQIADLSITFVHRSLKVLEQRGIVQCRGRWRALLPPAIANRLARDALSNIPCSRLLAAFGSNHSRLLTSFSRRLGYLHGSAEACAIVRFWLEPGGWLARPATFGSLGVTLFINVAPAVPELALSALEIAADSSPDFLSSGALFRGRWLNLLRKIAYDEALFERAAILLARFAAAESVAIDSNSAHRELRRLFQIIGSGTQAQPPLRLQVIGKLLEACAAASDRCALAGLEEMLRARHFSGPGDLAFGAQSRGLGWAPPTLHETRAWYEGVIDFTIALFGRRPDLRRVLCELIARRFRELWTATGAQDKVEKLAEVLARHGGWIEGWTAVRLTLRFDRGRLSAEHRDRLLRMAEKYRPRDLASQVRAFVLSTTHDVFDLIHSEAQDEDGDSDEAPAARVGKIIDELARQLTGEPAVLTELLPTLLSNGVGQRAWLGRGLALAAPDLAIAWTLLRDQYRCIPESQRHPSLLCGFLAGANTRDPAIVEDWLDRAIHDDELGAIFPWLQTSIPITPRGAERLCASLRAGLAPIASYESIGHGRVADLLSPIAHAEIVLAVADREGGFPIALELMTMRLFTLGRGAEIPHATLTLGRTLLSRADFTGTSDSEGYRLDGIAEACLAGADGAPTAQVIARNFLRALRADRYAVWPYRTLIAALFRLQGTVSLDELIAEQPYDQYRSIKQSFDIDHAGPVQQVPGEVLIAWANEAPADRFPKLAYEIPLVQHQADGDKLTLSPLAKQLLTGAPDRVAILDAYSSHFLPTEWSGSAASVAQPYLDLCETLQLDPDVELAAWARKQMRELREWAELQSRRARSDEARFE